MNAVPYRFANSSCVGTSHVSAVPARVEQSVSVAGLGRNAVAVLAESPVIAEGLGQLVLRTGMFEVRAATTTLDDVLDLVARNEVQMVVISASAQAMDSTLVGIQAVGGMIGRRVGTVGIVPATEGVRVERTVEASSVVTTEEGVDGLTRALFEARARKRRPSHAATRVRRPDAARARAESGRAALTPREIEVLQGMTDGQSTKHIAEQLNLSVHTVRTHVQRLLPKLGVHTRLRAIAVALDEGLVEHTRATPLAARYAVCEPADRNVSTAG